MPRVGIIRCNVESATCAGYKCFPAMRQGASSWAQYSEPVELVGFDTCGGCNRGKAGNVVARALRLKEKGAEAIHLGNCLVGNCPWRDLYAEAISKETGLRVVFKTH